MKAKAIAIAVSSLAIVLPAAAQTTTSSGKSTAADMKQDVKEAGLTGKVHAALAKDAGLKTMLINVDSHGNNVTLKGTVDSEATKSKVEQIAKGVEGVASVDNQLTIKPKG